MEILIDSLSSIFLDLSESSFVSIHLHQISRNLLSRELTRRLGVSSGEFGVSKVMLMLERPLKIILRAI